MAGIDLRLSLLLLAIPALVLLHLAVAPYTKVEESFNIQAAHDLLVYGTPISSNAGKRLAASYDHFTFPGAVPRTFVGAVLLAGLGQPIVAIAGFQYAQFIVRAILGLFNAGALVFFALSVKKAFGSSAAAWYVALQASQFHVIFYASRTLPNMFAFGMTTIATALLLPTTTPRSITARHRLAISLLVFAAVIFRSEVAILLGSHVLYLLAVPLTSLDKVAYPFALASAVALLITVPVDSYFWQRALWPELWGFYYNAVQGSASAWGVSPWHYYFTSALPRLLLNPLAYLALLPWALRQPATARAACQLVVPNLLFVAIYSLQPHKEARFVFYAVPALTAAAALGAAHVSARAAKSPAYRLGALLVAASVLACLAASTGMLLLSSLNYPGGEALAFLREVVESSSSSSSSSAPPSAAAATAGNAVVLAPVVPVHADVLSCMTGVTLFGAGTGGALPTHFQPHLPDADSASAGSVLSKKTDGNKNNADADAHTAAAAAAAAAAPPPPVLVLDKTEGEAALRDPTFWTRFDYLLVGDRAAVRGGEWEPVGVVEAYAGVQVLRPGDVPADAEKAEEGRAAPGVGTPVVGRGALVAAVRDRVRGLTGGWWAGPRMEPRVWVLRRVKGGERRGASKEVTS
ncbi:uncharacterized protein E0L32_009615 [Thyridium curvatum]|uniref:Mannosyltransferase n=1 Tax=Thyridium curvatum TaxID=1093900 RepID=A0A507AVF9_9PEZI|nr:uncharacterized protein E0L32_009615 [Thyridium curvatum]TPX08911.1 hypothetical protein E0L32_009615 [Thyridium curvatum]